MSEWVVKKLGRDTVKAMVTGLKYGDSSYEPLGITVVEPGIKQTGHGHRLSKGTHYASEWLEVSGEYDSLSALEHQLEEGHSLQEYRTVEDYDVEIRPREDMHGAYRVLEDDSRDIREFIQVLEAEDWSDSFLT